MGRCQQREKANSYPPLYHMSIAALEIWRRVWSGGQGALRSMIWQL